MSFLEKEIAFKNHGFVLSNQKSLYWSAEKVLIISDLHLGKAAHFRKNGIAIPSQVSEKDLLRLHQLLDYYQPSSLVIVGDFVHNAANKEMLYFTALRNQFRNTEFVLIKGNHDRVPSSFMQELGIDSVLEQLTIKDILFVHHPSETEIRPAISGHLHPGISLRLPTQKIQNLPCLIVRENNLILPAFSNFTGLYTQHQFSEVTDYYALDQNFIFKL